MPPFISCGVVVRGACYPTTSPCGRWSTRTFGAGDRTASGRGMTSTAAMCEWRPASADIPVPKFSIAHQSRRPKQGEVRRRRGETDEGAQASPPRSSLGLLLAVIVTDASVPDRDGAKSLLDKFVHKPWRLRHLSADGAYVGQLADWVRALGRGCRSAKR